MTSILKNVVKKFSSLIVLVLEQIRHKEAFTQSMPLQLIHEKKKKKKAVNGLYCLCLTCLFTLFHLFPNVNIAL